MLLQFNTVMFITPADEYHSTPQQQREKRGHNMIISPLTLLRTTTILLQNVMRLEV